MEQYKQVFAIGDIHGKQIAIENFVETEEIENSLIIQVGDYGVGYLHPIKDNYRASHMEDVLKQRNNELLVIRGNHDDPKYFVPDSPLNRSNVTFLPDYTYKTINGLVFLFVGGAVSIDRTYNTLDKDYWHGEEFRLHEDVESLPECDIMITHTAPHGYYPFEGFFNIQHYLDTDDTLKDDLLKEREDLRFLVDHVKPKKAHYYGHYHKTKVIYVDGVLQRCLNIGEIVEVL